MRRVGGQLASHLRFRNSLPSNQNAVGNRVTLRLAGGGSLRVALPFAPTGPLARAGLEALRVGGAQRAAGQCSHAAAWALRSLILFLVGRMLRAGQAMTVAIMKLCPRAALARRLCCRARHGGRCMRDGWPLQARPWVRGAGS